MISNHGKYGEDEQRLRVVVLQCAGLGLQPVSTSGAGLPAGGHVRLVEDGRRLPDRRPRRYLMLSDSRQSDKSHNKLKMNAF